MASEQNSVGLNGNYAATQSQGYPGAEHSYGSISMSNSSVTGAAEFNGTSSTNTSANNNPELRKDEVGWYFVEQYYTTLSRSPEKIFLFYNKKSQYVSGTETEKVPVCVGQKAINDRIKELDIQDCKVRVTNVDSQGSGSNIVIQVIGEMSNKATPHRKFTQTFVLAEQLNGYFVLNDIFRYIVEDDEVATEEEVPARSEATAGFQEPPATALESTTSHTLTSSQDKAEQEHDVEKVDHGLVEAIKEEPTIAAQSPPAEVNGVEPEVHAETTEVEEQSSTSLEQEIAAEEEPEVAEPAQEPTPDKTPERPITPAVTPPKPIAAQPEVASASSKPSVPKTWASLVSGGGNRIATPVTPAVPAVPTQQPAAPPAAKVTPPQVSTAAPAQPSTQASVAPLSAPSADADPADATQTAGSEWQTAGHDHGKKQGRVVPVPAQQENSRGYIKNVNDTIDGNTLRAALTKVAEVTYLDINRTKNCAFVDFASSSGYQAAIAANPLEVNGERLYIEERRIRPGAFGPFSGPRGGAARGGRGGAGPEGRPANGPGRGGFQGKEGGRGGFPPRGRGGVGGRGRGTPQAA